MIIAMIYTVSFDPSSRGQIAMVIYEWRDAKYLGIDTEPDNYLVPVSFSVIYLLQ